MHTSKLSARIKEEIGKLLPPTLFFFITLHLVALFRVLMLEGTGIAPSSSLSVTVVALVFGKAVLIADLLPFINRYPDKPLAYNIAWKTTIYVLVSALVHYLERLIDFWRETGGFIAGNQRLLAEIVWPHFWAIQILLVILMAQYAAIRWPTWGGLNEPPRSATERGISCTDSFVARPGQRHPLLAELGGLLGEDGHLHERRARLHEGEGRGAAGRRRPAQVAGGEEAAGADADERRLGAVAVQDERRVLDVVAGEVGLVVDQADHLAVHEVQLLPWHAGVLVLRARAAGHPHDAPQRAVVGNRAAAEHRGEIGDPPPEEEHPLRLRAHEQLERAFERLQVAERVADEAEAHRSLEPYLTDRSGGSDPSAGRRHAPPRRGGRRGRSNAAPASIATRSRAEPARRSKAGTPSTNS